MSKLQATRAYIAEVDAMAPGWFTKPAKPTV
jgi:hypothetical protein